MKPSKYALLTIILALPPAGVLALVETAPARTESPGGEIPLSDAKIYWEYNDSANDLGVHVFLDGEDWIKLKIENPEEEPIFKVKGTGPYAGLGLTELFYEGAEPSLEDVPLEELLSRFPPGTYDFEGRTVDGEEIEGEAWFTHAIPDGPKVAVVCGVDSSVGIEWSEVTAPPPGFPDEPIVIVGYQVIVEPSFQVTLPATARRVTIPPEYVKFLGSGLQKFEVLAIEQSGNQTLTEGEFTL